MTGTTFPVTWNKFPLTGNKFPLTGNKFLLTGNRFPSAIVTESEMHLIKSKLDQNIKQKPDQQITN